jgi:ABC-type Na+ efflux pump permease subunit
VRSRSHALQIARLHLLDAIRDRRAFVTSLLLPFLMLGAFGLLGVAGSRDRERDKASTVKVAVDSSTVGADRLLAALDSDTLRIVRSRQPAGLVVRDKADVALTVPASADDLLAHGRPLEVEVLAGSGGRAVAGLDSTHPPRRPVALETSGRPADVDLTTDQLEGHPKAVASALARTMPLLALIITLPFLASGIRALTKTRADRSIEHLLPLPLPRSTLLLGLALGTIGGEAVQQLLLLGILAIAAPSLAAGGAIPWSGPPVLAVALVVSSLTAGSIGVLLGVIARSEKIVSLMFGVTGALFFAAASGLQLADNVPHGPQVTFVPIIGPALAARAAFTPGGVGLAAFAAMVAGGAAAIVGALRLASRRLGSGGGLRL